MARREEQVLFLDRGRGPAGFRNGRAVSEQFIIFILPINTVLFKFTLVCTLSFTQYVQLTSERDAGTFAPMPGPARARRRLCCSKDRAVRIPARGHPACDPASSHPLPASSQRAQRPAARAWERASVSPPATAPSSLQRHRRRGSIQESPDDDGDQQRRKGRQEARQLAASQRHSLRRQRALPRGPSRLDRLRLHPTDLHRHVAEVRNPALQSWYQSR